MIETVIGHHLISIHRNVKDASETNNQKWESDPLVTLKIKKL